jgi:hypothetical protein
VRAALDAVPDPVNGLLVYRGRGGGAGAGTRRRPRPFAGAGAVELPEPAPVEPPADPVVPVILSGRASRWLEGGPAVPASAVDQGA